jgi:glycosyltransferase involved in cell wall biosynthesis
MKIKTKVAVVTDELAGFNKGGGIGTCARSLVQDLVNQNFDVDIIITHPDEDFKKSRFAGCDLISVANLVRERGYEPADHVVYAYCTHELLCQTRYRVVHFNDWRGSGFFYAMAAQQGLVESFIVTHTHGPSKWVREYNLELSNIDMSEIDTLEFGQIESSHLVVSPSQYLLNWYQKAGAKLPAAKVVNWQLPEWQSNEKIDQTNVLTTRAISPNSLKEIIFFGRHEKRKGFDIFLKAVASKPSLKNLDIIFIGRFDRIDREFTGSMALRMLPQHGGAIRFINSFDHHEAMTFLNNRQNAIVVLPSAIENSPCTVGECFSIGIPFIATAVGGTPELFANDVNAPNLVPYSAKDLAQKLEEVASCGLDNVTSTLRPRQIQVDWSEIHNDSIRASNTKTTVISPSVTVCLVHYNRPKLLERALEALGKQTYKNFDVVLVDDGSNEKNLERLKVIEKQSWEFDLKVIYSENKYLGAARNIAASNAQGEFLIFHDDDNISEPNQVELFVKAITIGDYDLLTSQYLVFDEHADPSEANIRYFPMGVGGAFSFFRNRFGDANAIIKKTAFQTIGGFSELREVGWEDWEFFLKCHIAGLRLGLVPYPLFRYRANASGMLSTTSIALNHWRILNVAIEKGSILPAQVLEFAKRDAIGKHILDQTWTKLELMEHSELHHELTSLDPNSDAAREKLMELAFAMGRHADAIDLGLRLKNGFHRVVKLIELISPRYGITKTHKSIPGKFRVISPFAISLKGWIDHDGIPPIGQIFLDATGRYQIISWQACRRDDVNEFLGRKDSYERGFSAIGKIIEAREGIKEARMERTLMQQSEKDFKISLSSIDLQYGDASIEISGLRASKPKKGFLDAKQEGAILEIDIQDNCAETWINTMVLKAPNGASIYRLDPMGLQFDEIEIDSKGEASFEIQSGLGETIKSDSLKQVRFFVSSKYEEVFFTLYAVE